MELCINDLGVIHEALFEGRTKWYNIGLMVKVPVDTLDSIEDQFDDPSDKLRQMLKAWVKTGKKRTWQSLVDALGARTVGELKLSRDIERAHCSRADSGQVNRQIKTKLKRSTPQQTTTEKQMQTLQQELQDLKKTNEQLRLELQQAYEKVEENSIQHAATEARERQLNQELQDLQNTNKQLRLELQHTYEKVEEKQHAIEASERQLWQQLQTIKQATAQAEKNLLQGQMSGDLSWQKCTNIPEKMLRGTAVSDGKMVYFNSELSTKLYAYNSDTQQWSGLPDCPFSWSSLVIVQHMLTTVGGVLGYDPTNSLCSLTGEGSDRKWSAHFSVMPTKRWWVATVCRGQSLIVAGGFDGRNRLSTVEVMDTETQQWSNVDSLPHPFYSATAAICEDRLYILGGKDESGVTTLSALTCSISELLRPLTVQEKLKPAEQPTVWCHIADAPYYASTCANICGQLIAIGGREADNEATAVCAYNAKSDSW